MPFIDTPFRVLELGYPTEVEGSVGAIYKRDWNPEHVPEGCPPSSRVQINFPKSKVNNSPVKMIWLLLRMPPKVLAQKKMENAVVTFLLLAALNRYTAWTAIGHARR